MKRRRAFVLLALAAGPWVMRAATAHAETAAAATDSTAAPAMAAAAPRTLRGLFIPAVHVDVARLNPGWRGAAFLGVAGTAAGLTATHDLTLERHLTAHDSGAQRDLARWSRPLGNQIVIGGGIAAWGIAWYMNHPRTYAAVQRADLSIATAGLFTIAVKEVVGRWRPDESPLDASRFDPFSTHDSFPSGHTTLAFATAAALDRETSSRWVPAIAYPAAAVVAWSRMHDHKHWPTDVIAGAAIGFGISWKVEDALRPRANGASATTGARIGIETGDGALAAVRLRW